MFDITEYEYDKEQCRLEIGGEDMMFHCHHYLSNLQKTVFDAEYMDGTNMIIGCAADSVYLQLKDLCKDLNEKESKALAQDMYKTFGNGLIDLSSMDENGVEVTTTKSVISKAWEILFESSDKPVDCYTTGFIAAAYAVIYNKELKNIDAKQIECMTMGAEANVHVIKEGSGTFPIYPAKKSIEFNPLPFPKSHWEHAQTITDMFTDAHKNFLGNEEGFIPAFGVYIVNNQSDYVNRVQFEFIKAVEEFAGEYGTTLGSELLMEAGYACGFFTLGGILSSPEWENAVKPYLKEPEDWGYAAIALSNNMGWGYQYIEEISKEKMVFRNYSNFEDYSYLRMYGKSKTFKHWANSGGWSSLMPLLYNSELIKTGKIDFIRLYDEVRKSKFGYSMTRTRGLSCGDKYTEMQVSL